MKGIDIHVVKNLFIEIAINILIPMKLFTKIIIKVIIDKVNMDIMLLLKKAIIMILHIDKTNRLF